MKTKISDKTLRDSAVRRVQAEWTKYRKRVLRQSRSRIFLQALQIAYHDQISVLLMDYIEEMDSAALSFFLTIPEPVETFYSAWKQMEDTSEEELDVFIRKTFLLMRGEIRE